MFALCCPAGTFEGGRLAENRPVCMSALTVAAGAICRFRSFSLKQKPIAASDFWNILFFCCAAVQ